MCRDGSCGHYTDEYGRMIPDQKQAKIDYEAKVAKEREAAEKAKTAPVAQVSQ